MIKSNNIAFDIDGVFADIMSPFKKILKDKYNDEIITHNSHRIKTKGGLSNNKIWKIFDQAFEEYENVPVYDGATKLCQELYALTGDPIRFVTSRPKRAAVLTHQLVETFCDVPFFIGFAEDSKLPYLNNIHFFVEDRRKITIELAEADKTVFLVDTYYNQADFNGLSSRIFRIYGIKDLLPMVHIFVNYSN